MPEIPEPPETSSDDLEGPEGVSPEGPVGPEGPTPDPSTADIRKDRVRRLKEELFGDLLSTSEVAEVLEVHPRTVGDYIREGRLHAIQVGGGWKVPEEALRDFVRGLTEAGTPPKQRGIFSRFTHKARAVTVHALDEARSLGHDYIGTEHLLLGLLDAPDGVASKALVNLGLNVAKTRQQVKDLIGEGAAPVTAKHIPFTPRAKKVLEISLREALTLGHKYIGSEHLLLGLVREGHGIAAQVLHSQGISADQVKTEVIRLLSTGEDPKETG